MGTVKYGKFTKPVNTIAQFATKLIFDYPSVPIGGDNPYWKCASCGISQPEINGKVENHLSTCAWRKNFEQSTT